MRPPGPFALTRKPVPMVLLAAATLTTALALTPHAARAQQDTTAARTAAAPDTTRPFVAGGVYDKPYQTRLLGRTAVGGYAEGHFRWEREEGATHELGFEAKRFNLFTSTVVSDFVRMGAELEVEEGGEEIKLEYAAIDLLISPSLTVRGGMILSPLGRFNLSHDSPRNPFTDRPLVSTELLGVALSEAGMGVFGTVPTGATGRLTYEAYAVNGFDSDIVEAGSEGTRIPLGRQNFEDENASPALVGRLAFSPRVGTEVGLSAHHGAWNVFREEGLELEERRNLTIVVLDAEVEVLGVRLAGEAADVSLDVPPDIGLFASSQRGFYLDAVWDFGHGLVATMPDSHFSAKVRLDAVDFDTDADGDSLRRLTLGLNFRPTRDTVVKLGYLRGESRDAFNNLARSAGLLFSLATYF